ncbi:hypothetical protein P692DRAFT_20535654 [Suillus brevipes Sb2]|nr:hypothetical protein P692DRAFT_20535654 [Suillus brevipes Sb2]
MAQVALPLVQDIAGAIPLLGAPMKAAISGLLTGLQAIDRRSQNKSDLDALTSRLNRLCLNLCNAPPARDPAEQYRRDSFVGYSFWIFTTHSPKGRNVDDELKSDLQSFIVDYRLIVRYAGTYFS